ncbi:carbohydrate sulfotransferase 15-like [Argopecten irradians]|uniref:carbohydrate sulfotransferase 15-like n=1 Tax=Argopecten irradians TaxID=31199 RepID=UPI003716D65C
MYSRLKNTVVNGMFQRYYAILATLILISIIYGLIFTSMYLKTITKIHNNVYFNHFNGTQMHSKDKWIGNSRLLKWNDTEHPHPKWITRSGPFVQLLKMKTPVFLPGIKNPCWYGDDDNRREIWIQHLCNKFKSRNTNLCSIYSPRKKPKNIRLLRCLPYFMLIGQPKSGSTDLFYRIMKHPDVLSGISKEPHWLPRRRHCQYLDTEYCPSTDPWTLTEYIDYFNSAAERIHDSNNTQRMNFITGEGSQSTLWDLQWWWKFPENKNDEEPGLLNAHLVRHFLPDVKLLVILRNPVDRLYSDYLFFNPDETKSAEVFHSRVSRSVALFKDCLMTHSLRHCAYKGKCGDVRLTIGLYSVYLEDWMTVFPRKQFFITSLDDYSKNQTLVASKIFKFLRLRDVDNYINRNPILNQRKLSARRVGEMFNKTRVILEQFYKPFNQALSTLLNDSVFLWET